jgi:Y-X(10)_GDL-associated radical SAM protein
MRDQWHPPFFSATPLFSTHWSLLKSQSKRGAMKMGESRSVRDNSFQDRLKCVPVYVVWELTLACNLRCNHCGSRAGKRREGELSTAECLDLIDQLARLGTREITIIGGEAFLRKDWLEIIRHIDSHGIVCGMQSGGYNLNERRIKDAAQAGLRSVGVSLDGLEESHDRIRGVKGSFDHALRALRFAKAEGIFATVNTQVGAHTMAELHPLMQILFEIAVKVWRLQLTVAMGNAVDNPEMLMQPYQMLELMPMIANMYREAEQQGMKIEAGNNIGFFGPYEHLLRGSMRWAGCAAGQNVIGIEADGTIKSCPSLATADFAAGNIRELTMEDIWNWSERMHHTRLRSVDDLWGFCRTCYFGEVCRAGCTWTAHSLFGKAGNNPYCHYRALELEKRGLRERVVKKADAPDLPFSRGDFELVAEPIPGREHVTAAAPQTTVAPPRLIQIQYPSWTKAKAGEPPLGVPFLKMKVCAACQYHMYNRETQCPHCGHSEDIAAGAVAAASVAAGSGDHGSHVLAG